jgi:hypothetical protein
MPKRKYTPEENAYAERLKQPVRIGHVEGLLGVLNLCIGVPNATFDDRLDRIDCLARSCSRILRW